MAIHNTRKFAVVTGASSGIGYQLAKQCVSNGFDAIVCSEDEGIESAATTLGALGGGIAIGVRCDLATVAGCEELARAVTQHGRPVDALLLNAGVGVGGAFMTTTLEAELKMIALNCNHTVIVPKLLLPEMVKRGSGMVLMTGSVASTAPHPYLAVYGATKAFVMNFGEALRYELKDSGVTVTVLQPGPTDTNFFERAHMENTPVGQGKKDPAELVAKQGFDAMIAGKDSVLGGSLKNRALGLMNEVLPETMKAAQTSVMTKPIEPKQ